MVHDYNNKQFIVIQVVTKFEYFLKITKVNPITCDNAL